MDGPHRQSQATGPGGVPPDDEFWRAFLNQGGDTMQGIGRRIFRRIPADPRCRRRGLARGADGGRGRRERGRPLAAAAPGELLVSADAATAAGLDPTLERRSLDLKGKELPTEVVALRVG